MSPKPVFEKLSKLSKKKLDQLEYDHNRYLEERFRLAKDGKVQELQRSKNKHDDLKGQAIRDKATSMPLAMSKAMEMRHVKAEELIVRARISVIRSNQFYHRLMLVLIQVIPRPGWTTTQRGSRI